MGRFPKGAARIAAAVGLAGAITLGVALPASAAAASNAYGVRAALLAGAIRVAPTPQSDFPSGSDLHTVTVDLGSLGTVQVLNASTTGDNTAGTSTAKASIGKVRLGISPLVTANNSGVKPAAVSQVQAKAAAIKADAITATCQANGGKVWGDADLANVVLGNSFLDAHPAANSEVGIPGVLSVKLNEQIKHNGVLEVNAVHIKLLSGVGGDLVLGHAQCGPNAPEEGSPIVTKGFLGGLGVLLFAGVGGFFIRRRRTATV
jgi:hypothetical protein